jgi:hypothetical protein
MTRETPQSLSYQNARNFFEHCLDELIDEVAYKFYGLIEAEIEIVEEAVGQ